MCSGGKVSCGDGNQQQHQHSFTSASFHFFLSFCSFFSLLPGVNRVVQHVCRNLYRAHLKTSYLGLKMTMFVSGRPDAGFQGFLC